MSTVLQTKNLCKTYIIHKRQNNVLKNIDLTVNEGEMVAIMGPSGSGKSTLLYCVSGMDRITSGEVKFNGKDTTKLKEKELAKLRLDEMGFIFQQMYMMKNLSILDNIILPAVKSKKNDESRKKTEERGRALMRRLGIDDIGGNDINEVSIDAKPGRSVNHVCSRKRAFFLSITTTLLSFRRLQCSCPYPTSMEYTCFAPFFRQTSVNPPVLDPISITTRSFRSA